MGEPGRVKVQLVRAPFAAPAPQMEKIPPDSAGEEESFASEDEAAGDENGLEIQDAPMSRDLEEESSLNVEKYRHLFKDNKVARKFVHDLLKNNPDVKTAVDLIKKTFDANITYFDGKKIS